MNATGKAASFKANTAEPQELFRLIFIANFWPASIWLVTTEWLMITKLMINKNFGTQKQV
jgi:hypothetical protein